MEVSPNTQYPPAAQAYRSISPTNRLPAVAELALVHANMWFEARVPSCRTTTGTWSAILPKIFAYLGA